MSNDKGAQMLDSALSMMKSASASILQQEYAQTYKSQEIDLQSGGQISSPVKPFETSDI